ncbi:hypothetical protein RO3G_01560 [Rhizopus delemar RA 99-880]|uniref:Uncharacterized protein n=1 Tax=Rhizopus delemar (strain RA 99-880 / ATCC MYA-4621 / FGSC 9543 / NRRL 43880) TaxID=246409 RepID=I1BKX6_RHIO9|nr:hypothetical protein RO3G_01560 [Rhizopus delemar RA 99-880]|eukprot:EIE76856.1 hypothetical protein RO3G_01560 [Rhizopus delemar RA 99-880]
MSYNIDQVILEIRKCNSVVGDLRREFQAWKDEVRQELGELKLMMERNASARNLIPQAPIYQPPPPLINPPIFDSVCRDIPRFPVSLGSGQHHNSACIEAFLRETMGLLITPEDSNERIDDKQLLVKQYHAQLNRFTQVTCMDLATKLLADARVDNNKLSWKEIPDVYKNTAYKELEEFALRANIPLNRCCSFAESNTHLTEQVNSVDPEENLDVPLLPDLDAVNNIKEEESDEIDFATSSNVLSPCAVTSHPPSPPTRTLRTRFSIRSSSRSNKKRKT